MTSKIQIDQATIARALEAYYGDGFVANGMTEKRMHRALEAALNPPEEPEIPVSEAMREAGIIAMNRHTHNGTGIGWFVHFQHFAKAAEDAYRAMEKARRKEEVCDHEWKVCWVEGGGGRRGKRGERCRKCRENREVDEERRKADRRKDDPK